MPSATIGSKRTHVKSRITEKIEAISPTNIKIKTRTRNGLIDALGKTVIYFLANV